MNTITITKLRAIINKEGITPADLSRGSGISAASINRYLKGTLPKDAYKSRIINVINTQVGKEKYKIEDVFSELLLPLQPPNSKK